MAYSKTDQIHKANIIWERKGCYPVATKEKPIMLCVVR